MSSKTLKTLTVPGGVLLAVVALLAYSGWLTLAPPALSFLYYCSIAGGMLLAWRFHSSRIFFALLVLFLAQQASALTVGTHSFAGAAGWTTLAATSVLVPLDFVLIAFTREGGFTVSGMSPLGLLLFVQTIIVTVLAQSSPTVLPLSSRAHHATTTTTSIPGYVSVTFAVACLFLLVRWLVTRKPTDNALLWS